jgi:uncharacterized protein (TIGR00369 family)
MSARPRFAAGPEELLGPAELSGLSGLEFMTGMLEGRLPAPPIAALADMVLTHVGEGEVVFEAEPGFRHYNPLGTVHGGWFGILLDSAMACAVMTRLPRGQGYTTLEYKVNMIRPVTRETGRLTARGTALHAGRRTAVAEARLTDAAGRLCATGSTTCLVFAFADAAPGTG